METRVRVLMTGYGVASAVDDASNGSFFDAFFHAGKSGKATQTTQIRAVTSLRSEDLIDERQLRRMDRFSKLGMVAALRGMKHSEYVISPTNANRTGIIFNTCFGPLSSTVSYLTKFIKDGPRSAPAGVFPYTVSGVFTGLITMNLKALGTNSTVCGCSPVGYGFDTLQQCTDDAVLVGGCDELTPEIVGWCEHAGHLPSASGTDSAAGSMVLGEGAATVLLEEWGSALDRGAHPLAEILDYATGSSGCADQPFHIDAEAISAVIRRALASSGVLPEQIGFVVSGSNGATFLNQSEHEALEDVFCGLTPVPVVDVKQVIGETFGASGVFSVIVLAETLQRQIFPQGDGTYDLGPAEVGLALCYEFGGNVDCVVARRYDERTS